MRVAPLYVLFILFVSCSNKTDSKKPLLDKKQMSKVMWEMAQADVFVTQFVKYDSTKDITSETIILQKEIFKLNNITKDQFYDSYNYYKMHPDLMKVILDSITATSEKERLKSIIPIQ